MIMDMGMDYIVAFLHPFLIPQKVRVFKNGIMIEETVVSINELREQLYARTKANGINKIRLAGGYPFAEKLKKEFETLYTEDHLEIEII